MVFYGTVEFSSNAGWCSVWFSTGQCSAQEHNTTNPSLESHYSH